MSLEKLSEVRVLLVAHKVSGTQILRTVFALAGVTKLTLTYEPRHALELLCTESYDAVFVEGALEYDVICRPVSPKTIGIKLRGVLAQPRPFIAAPGFFGPDRRAKSRATGTPAQERRTRAAKKTKVSVSLV